MLLISILLVLAILVLYVHECGTSYITALSSYVCTHGMHGFYDIHICIYLYNIISLLLCGENQIEPTY